MFFLLRLNWILIAAAVINQQKAAALEKHIGATGKEAA